MNKQERGFVMVFFQRCSLLLLDSLSVVSPPVETTNQLKPDTLYAVNDGDYQNNKHQHIVFDV